jgi:beta-glucosidase
MNTVKRNIMNLSSLIAVLLVLLNAAQVRAADIVPVITGGDWTQHAASGQTEINGTQFTVAFPGLPAGAYTVIVEAAEIYFAQPGQRVMDVSSGPVVIAKGWDVFQEAGGKNKTVAKSVTVQHAADDIGGPLGVTFQATVNKAKFSVIRIKAADGKQVALADAANFKQAPDDFGSQVPVVSGPEIWKDTTQGPEARTADLIKRLSLREKVSQLVCGAVAIKRLGIPEYNWESEALHGVMAHDQVTVFPQPIGIAASFNNALWQQASDVISTEGRAKFNETFRKQGGSTVFQGISYSAPNINIFRDPRWGRGHETYGEDPFLTARMGVAYVKGLQGDDPHYIKTVATPKHYAVHSGPESLRHVFDANANDQDLWETYLPAFEATIVEGKAWSIMGAYNRFRGESCSSSQLLLNDILRGKWGFKGYVISDMDSVADIWATHKLEKNAAGASARAIKNGMDLCMGGMSMGGGTYMALTEAVQNGLCTESDVDRALARSLNVRFRLGLLDPLDKVAYAQIPLTACDTPENDALALECARESMVLLKNTENLLPLAKKGTVAVIGPNADCEFERGWMGTGQSTQYGNYSGAASHPINVLSGIRRKLEGVGKVLYAKGCTLTRRDAKMTAEALAAAEQADTIIMVMGMSASDLANREPEASEKEGSNKTGFALPAAQSDLIREIAKTGKPIVLVLMNGSSLSINWEAENLPAILEAWYPGQRGDAVADVLFGDYNPAGRLPITFYKTEADLPDITNYDMHAAKGRTYRYFKGEPLFAFGYGLSYTTFAYSAMKVEGSGAENRKVSVDVKNTGSRAGDELVQLYIRRTDAPTDAALPLRSLRGFARVKLAPGETKTVVLTLTPFQFAFADPKGERRTEGEYEIAVGGSQKAAQVSTVKFETPIVAPRYEYVAPTVKSKKEQR